MNVLCVGDVVGDAGLAMYGDCMPALKRDLAVDFTIVNGENSDKSGTGLTRHSAEALLQHADVVTSGNHGYDRAGEELYLENERVIHPANYPYTEDEAGCVVADTGRLGTVCVINLAGVGFMEPIDSPFIRADALLKRHAAKFTIVDFHAESTAEKKALGFYLDGRISALYGTHTHVQTADEQVLPQGTGFLSDVGMSGPIVSVLGMSPESAVQRQRTHVRNRFAVADGPCMINAALFCLDDTTGLCAEAKRVQLWQTAGGKVEHR